jgi:hypothetical protein
MDYQGLFKMQAQPAWITPCIIAFVLESEAKGK